MSFIQEKRKSLFRKLFWAFIYINASVIVYRTSIFFYENGIGWETINSKYGWPIVLTILSLIIMHIVDDNVRYNYQGGFSRRELRQLVKDRNKQLRDRWKAKQRNPKW